MIPALVTRVWMPCGCPPCEGAPFLSGLAEKTTMAFRKDLRFRLMLVGIGLIVVISHVGISLLRVSQWFDASVQEASSRGTSPVSSAPGRSTRQRPTRTRPAGTSFDLGPFGGPPQPRLQQAMLHRHQPVVDRSRLGVAASAAGGQGSTGSVFAGVTGVRRFVSTVRQQSCPGDRPRRHPGARDRRDHDHLLDRRRGSAAAAVSGTAPSKHRYRATGRSGQG